MQTWKNWVILCADMVDFCRLGHIYEYINFMDSFCGSIISRLFLSAFLQKSYISLSIPTIKYYST